MFKSSAIFADMVLANDYSKTPFERAMSWEGSGYQFWEAYPGRSRRLRKALDVFNDKTRIPFVGMAFTVYCIMALIL